MNPIKVATPTREPRYFARIGAEDLGPYDVHAMETLALNGTIAPTTLLALEGSTDFKPANEWPFFKQVFPAKVWTLAKTPPAFVTVNEGPKAPQSEADSPNDRPAADTRRRSICSMMELQARTAADPYDPIVTATMNEAAFIVKNDRVSREKALKRIFAANKEVNRHEDRLVRHARTSVDVALFRNSATKYSIVLGIACGLIMYTYPAARPNGQIALELIAAVYGICLFAARWIVRLPSSIYYVLTALEIYTCAWAVWVIFNIVRQTRMYDPFKALYNCLTRWHL